MLLKFSEFPVATRSFIFTPFIFPVSIAFERLQVAMILVPVTFNPGEKIFYRQTELSKDPVTWMILCHIKKKGAREKVVRQPITIPVVLFSGTFGI